MVRAFNAVFGFFLAAFLTNLVLKAIERLAFYFHIIISFRTRLDLRKFIFKLGVNGTILPSKKK